MRPSGNVPQGSIQRPRRELELPPEPDPTGEPTSMPSCDDSIAPFSLPSIWTPARAQAALSDAACQLLAVVDLLEQVHAGLPPPADIEDRLEGFKAYDVTTDILGAIECVLADDLRPAIGSLLRSATVTDEELQREHHAWLWRRRA
jgi:hypothetical protein